MHGAKSKRGTEHPNYKHGEHSKVYAEARRRLARAFERPIDLSVMLFPEPLEKIADRDFRRSRRQGQGLRGLALGLDQLADADRIRVIRAARRVLAQELAELRAEASNCPG
jgi:hypothetical protein